MTISSPTFQRLQDGIKSVDDLRVRGPVNAALAWLSGDLLTQLNAHFDAISQSTSVQIQAAIVAFSNSNSIQIAAAIAAKPSFMAHKNGSAQGSISATATPLTFGTETWDQGGFFASNGWTPPVGRFRISGSARFDTTNAVDNEALSLDIQRDGGTIARYTVARAGTTAPVTVAVTINISSSGSSVYTLAAIKTGAGVGNIEGGSNLTWFTGEQI